MQGNADGLKETTSLRVRLATKLQPRAKKWFGFRFVPLVNFDFLTRVSILTNEKTRSLTCNISCNPARNRHLFETTWKTHKTVRVLWSPNSNLITQTSSIKSDSKNQLRAHFPVLSHLVPAAAKTREILKKNDLSQHPTEI